MSARAQPLVASFTGAIGRAMIAERISRQPGLLQSLDPRVRVLGLLALLTAVILAHRLLTIAALLVLATVLALCSAVTLGTLAKRVWLVVFLFTGLMALPALFITPGAVLWSWRGTGLTITATGLKTCVLLILRVETAVTFTTLLVLATPWTQLLQALRALRLPQMATSILAMTHRYIFLLTETATQMFESRQSRQVGQLDPAARRKMMAGAAGALLGKSMDLSQDVYLAMQARGFRGELRSLTSFRMRARDYLGLACFFLLACLAVWAGR